MVNETIAYQAYMKEFTEMFGNLSVGIDEGVKNQPESRKRKNREFDGSSFEKSCNEDKQKKWVNCFYLFCPKKVLLN